MQAVAALMSVASYPMVESYELFPGLSTLLNKLRLPA